MSDMIVWLRQELDTDERAAERMEHATDSSEAYSCPATRDYPLGDLAYGEESCTCNLAARKARVLRQVQAHRAILDFFDSDDGDQGWYYQDHVLGALVSIYADRDGFKEEWVA